MADADLPPGVDPPADTSMTELGFSQNSKTAEEGSEQNSQQSTDEPKKKNLYADEYDLDADNPLAGSDDEEDGIQVTIGKIEPVVSFSMKHATHERQHTSKLDLDSLPRIGDTPIYDVDLASMDDRPWRKPGADITDYFNYGFTEETWNTYCERQKKLRSEFTSQAAVNKALFSNIYLANPLGMPVMGSRNISTIGDGPSTVKVLTDNGGRFKAHHHGMNEPVVRTVIGAPGNVSGPPGVNTPSNAPLMDFSKPPPGMSLPPPTVPVLGGPPGSESAPGMDGPPGVGLDGPPGIDVSSSSIPTVGSGAALDMSLPPPGFNPSLPPPGMSVRPPPIGLPPMNIGSAGFNSMLPPPGYNQVRYPMGSGGSMGRPPPLMGRDFGRDNGDMDDDRRNRKRSRSRSPRRSDRDRRRDDDRRDRDRKDRDRERSERSSRRHRSRSREDRDKRRDRKDDDSDRKRRRPDRDDDEERRERRRRRDEGRSPDRTPERSGSHDEAAE